MKKFFIVIFAAFAFSCAFASAGCKKRDGDSSVASGSPPVPSESASVSSDSLPDSGAALFSVILTAQGSVYDTVETDGRAISMPEDPVRENYLFDGWFWDENVWNEPFTLNSLFDRPLGGSSEYRVYAKWRGADCTVNFPASETVSFSPVTVEYGSPFSLPTPRVSGFIFEGWYCAENGGETMLTDAYGRGLENWSRSGTTAVYPRLSCEVIFELEGGEGAASGRYIYSKPFGTLPVPTKSGYTFGGWCTSSGTAVGEDTVFEDEGMTLLFASWLANEYKVTFESENGEAAETRLIKSGERYSLPEQPQKEGMSFAGWYTRPNGGGERIDAESIFSAAADQLLYARWSGDTFRVTFVGFGGEIAAEREISYGQPYRLDLVYEIMPDHIKYVYCKVPGYDFQGWYTQPNGGGQKISYGDVLSVPRDHSLYAYYTVSDAEVTTICSNASFAAYNAKYGYVVAYEQTDAGYELVVYDKNLNKKYTAWSGSENLYAYDTDSDYIVLADGSQEITVLNAADGSLNRKIDCTPWKATAVAMDGDILIICWGDGNALIKFYDLKTDNIVIGESPRSMSNPLLTVNKEDHIVYVSSVNLIPAALVYYSTQTGKILYEAPWEDWDYNYVTTFDGTHVWPKDQHCMRDAVTGEKLENINLDKYGGAPDDIFFEKLLYRYDENYVLTAMWEDSMFEGFSVGGMTYRLYDRESGRLLHVIYGNYATEIFVAGHFVILYDGEHLSVYEFGKEA